MYNSAARFNLAAVNVDLVYFVNFLENRVYRMIGTSKSDYVTDNLPFDTTEPFDRFNYPLRAPSSITYASMSDSLIFADTDNDRIMRLSFADLNIYYLVANAGGSPLFRRDRPAGDGAVEAEGGRLQPDHREDLLRRGVEQSGVVHRRGGEGASVCRHRASPGFSGDGGPATAAGLNDPRAIAVDSRGNAYIADYGNHAIRMVVGGALP